MELNTMTRTLRMTSIITSKIRVPPSLGVLMTPSTSECPRVDTFEATHGEIALFGLNFEGRVIRKFPYEGNGD